MSWYRVLLELLGLASKARVDQLTAQVNDQLVDCASPALIQAHELLAAVDRGGIPLSPIIVNRIARNLGLEVATTDLMAHTLERIRRQIAPSS